MDHTDKALAPSEYAVFLFSLTNACALELQSIQSVSQLVYTRFNEFAVLFLRGVN